MIDELPISTLAAHTDHLIGPQLQMVVASIAEGNTAGRLWQGAGSTLLWDQGNNVLYLGGLASDESRAALADLIHGPIRAAALSSNRAHFKTLALSEGLEATLPALFAGIELNPWPELFLAYQRADAPEVAAPTVAEITYLLIDQAMLARTDLSNLEPLREEIGWMWPDAERFAQHGFGYAASIEGRLVCWCTAEYVSRGMCGIGISTEPAYQRRGIASATAAHFVAEALRRGITPYWECVVRNTPSVRLAEKLGFTLIEQAPFRHGVFLA